MLLSRAIVDETPKQRHEKLSVESPNIFLCQLGQRPFCKRPLADALANEAVLSVANGDHSALLEAFLPNSQTHTLHHQARGVIVAAKKPLPWPRFGLFFALAFPHL